MDIEGPRNVPDRLAFSEQLRRNFSLIRIEFARATEAHATLFCCFPPGPGPLTDQIPLKLRDAGENRHDHLAGVCCGVCPWLGNGLELPACLIDRVHCVE